MNIKDYKCRKLGQTPYLRIEVKQYIKQLLKETFTELYGGINENT